MAIEKLKLKHQGGCLIKEAIYANCPMNGCLMITRRDTRGRVSLHPFLTIRGLLLYFWFIRQRGCLKWSFWDNPLFFVQDYVSPYKTCRLVSMLSVKGCPHGYGGFFRSPWESRFSPNRQHDEQCRLHPKGTSFGRFHISFSFSVGNDLCVVPVSICKGNGTQAVPYNHFTNYAVSICKQSGIILADLLFQFAVIW